MTIVTFVFTLFVSTFVVLSNQEPQQTSCGNYQKALITSKAVETTDFEISNLNEVYKGTLNIGYPGKNSVFDVKNQKNVPSICTKYVKSLTKRKACALVHKIHFYEYYTDQNIKFFLIRVYFKINDHHDIIVQVPVLENNEGGGEQINGELDRYLRQMEPNDKNQHALHWINEGIKSPVKHHKNHFQADFKVDTYFARCQYVPADTLKNFGERFGWTEQLTVY